MKNLKTINIKDILFLDIETVPQWRTIKDVPEAVKDEWTYKFKFRPDSPKLPHPDHVANPNSEVLLIKYDKYFADLWEAQAGLYAEFAKIVCISVGYLNNEEAVIKSYNHEDEAELLKAFKEDLNGFCNYAKFPKLCAHYGHGFDYPFINKRLLIHGLNIPGILDSWGLKPWEISLLDTHDMWKFGHYRADSGTLSSIAMAFGVPTPKDDISGADVARVYYEEARGVDRISKYCEKDVFTLIQIVRKMRGEALINPTIF
jgi:hypothetical protein